MQAEHDVDTASSEVYCQRRSPVKSPLIQTLSYPIQAEQNGLNDVAFYQPRSPTRYDSVPFLGASTQTQKQQERITELESEVKRLQNLQSQTQEQLQQLKSQNELYERERQRDQKDIEDRDHKIKKLEKSKAWLEGKLKDKEELLDVLLHEDQFDKIYRFVEAKSNTLVEGDRCIVCDIVPDKCSVLVRQLTQPAGSIRCNRPGKEHQQTCLKHKFTAQGGEDKCNYKLDAQQLCGQPEAQHHDLGHHFEAIGLCQSHFYPRGVLEAVCDGNKSWIYDGVVQTSRTPNDCKRRLICALCEPVTSKLEESLIERMKSKHTLCDGDEILFSVLAYRSMIFSLYHYQEDCCNRYRADVKSIIQYGWRCHYHLRYSPTDDIQPVPPVLLHLQSSRHEFPATLHFPAVCELDFTATNSPPPPELGNAVVAIYGCILPYHFVLLRDLNTAHQLQPYSQQIVRSINNRLSEELETYYDKNEDAKKWLKGQRKRPELEQHWYPVLTFGHLKCCLKIQVH